MLAFVRCGFLTPCRAELAQFFAFCDQQVADRQAHHRKGALAAFRDAVLFKLIYAWGLRRGETSMLDVVDFGPNPAVAAFGRFGSIRIRHGWVRVGAVRASRSC